MLGADYNTGRFESDFGTMRAKVALRCRALIRINVNGIVGASLHAGLATDAAIRTEIDDTVFALVHRRDRADGHAWRLLAVIATSDLKHAPGVREYSFFHVLNPGAIHRERHVVLGFARNGASVAANALPVIDYESVSHAGGLAIAIHRGEK